MTVSVRLTTRDGMWPSCRTLADDMRDDPRPVDTTPHAHFHEHGFGRHSHVHVHPDEHAHSTRGDLGAHTDD